MSPIEEQYVYINTAVRVHMIQHRAGKGAHALCSGRLNPLLFDFGAGYIRYALAPTLSGVRSKERVSLAALSRPVEENIALLPTQS